MAQSGSKLLLFTTVTKNTRRATIRLYFHGHPSGTMWDSVGRGNVGQSSKYRTVWMACSK